MKAEIRGVPRSFGSVTIQSAGCRRESYSLTTYGQNLIQHRNDFGRPALRHWSLHFLFQVALYLPSWTLNHAPETRNRGCRTSGCFAMEEVTEKCPIAARIVGNCRSNLELKTPISPTRFSNHKTKHLRSRSCHISFELSPHKSRKSTRYGSKHTR